jgi:CBS domain-containing protein
MTADAADGPADRVAQIMSSPLVTCAPDVALVEVAALMAEHRIHAVVVRPQPWVEEAEEWGVISDLDLAGALAAESERTPASRIAAGPVVVVGPGEHPLRAAELMAAHAVTHLLVAEPDGLPTGIVSALDVAGALAPADAGAAARGDEAPGLHAVPGDRLVIRGHHLGEPDRDAEILEVRGRDGAPPYRVRWSDDGRESLFYPGSDAHIDRITG